MGLFRKKKDDLYVPFEELEFYKTRDYLKGKPKLDE